VALYLEHFGLNEPPFRITPHTDFFFDGADRGATLEALIYAVLHDEGIVKVSGEVGSGKTMLCRVLMERLPQHVATIYLATPSLPRDEILHAIADELDLSLSRDRLSVALRELQEHLIQMYAAGRHVVILIDEAHAMPEETLEQVRLLSNLESNRHKLLQIVLFGQPELDETLAKPSLRQLRDRITHSFRTRPLSLAEVARYLSFRMRAAGYRGPDVFAVRAVRLMAGASSGLTRRINILADKSLLAAYTDGTHSVTPRHVRAAVRDSEFGPARAPVRPFLYIAAAALAGIAIGSASRWFVDPPVEKPQPVPEAMAVLKPVEPAPEPEAEPQLSADQARRLAGYSPDGQKLLAERLDATRQILERAEDEHYALELFMTDNADPARMERFLLRARELVPLQEVYIIPVVAGSHYRLWVVFGEFSTEHEAAAAARRLPPRYQQAFRVLPRSFSELRRAL
jgi:type II secretory pathway predicted ATPase ExeA